MLSVMYGVLAMMPTTFAIAGYVLVSRQRDTDSITERTTTMTQSTGKLFVLEASGDGRLFSINPDGSGQDVHRHRMPRPRWCRRRCRGRPHLLDQHGQCRRSTTARSSVWTSTEATAPRSFPAEAPTPPSSFISMPSSRKLYWSDREGMRVMRCDLDGSNVETLVQTGQGDDDRHDETQMVRRSRRRPCRWASLLDSEGPQ